MSKELDEALNKVRTLKDQHAALQVEIDKAQAYADELNAKINPTACVNAAMEYLKRQQAAIKGGEAKPEPEPPPKPKPRKQA